MSESNGIFGFDDDGKSTSLDVATHIEINNKALKCLPAFPNAKIITMNNCKVDIMVVDVKNMPNFESLAFMSSEAKTIELEGLIKNINVCNSIVSSLEVEGRIDNMSISSSKVRSFEVGREDYGLIMTMTITDSIIGGKS